MKLPGGDEVLSHGTGTVFESFQRAIAARDGSVPGKWPDLAAALQFVWMNAQRPFAEIIVLAIITDAIETVSRYDGCQGGAYRAALIRYATEELEIDVNAILQG